LIFTVNSKSIVLFNYKYIIFISLLVIFLLLGQNIQADIKIIIIDPKLLQYNLSPNKYDNSSQNYDNSSQNYDNSSSKYDNSPLNYQNGTNGNRRIISPDNYFLGYYTFGYNGIINFFTNNGTRFAYNPGGGHTQSVFMSEGGWCGIIATQNGQLILGLNQPCYLRLYQ
jgi:hypothetical protein